MNQPVLGVRGTAEYVKATGEGTAESPYIPVVQIEGGGGVGGKSNTYFGTYTITKNAEAATYAAGDVYGTRFELTKDGVDFGVANGSFFLTGVNLVSSLSSTTVPSGMGLFSLFLFNSEPLLISDNGAFTLASSSITPQGIPLNSLSSVTNATNLTSQTSQINELFRRGSSTLYGYLVTQSAFTPTNSAASTMAITLKAIEA